MYICSQVTSSRDGFLAVVYCLLPNEGFCDQLTAMNFKNILFYAKFSSFFLLFLLLFYLLGNVSSVISVIVISVYYCCQLANCIVLFVKLLLKIQKKI